jgi:hypothetical protein
MLLLVTSTARTSSVSASMPLSGHCCARPCRARYVYLAPTSRDYAAHNPAGQWMRRLEPPTARQHMLACVRGMLARIPLAFTFGFDPRAVDEEL